ncbi:hypothetical protein K488DRAFT_81959 [Vararia minispora EC-137]|uniref:Uncharacterized protein n=1 Tax=Vararia minispora EC-137 TaxID=1314806 RepID=A0ACB8QXZ4_9AGAM|nr:hypothetical protein K488DRAFT_81959 [Vararia minispora EC-137]
MHSHTACRIVAAHLRNELALFLSHHPILWGFLLPIILFLFLCSLRYSALQGRALHHLHRRITELNISHSRVVHRFIQRIDLLSLLLSDSTSRQAWLEADTAALKANAATLEANTVTLKVAAAALEAKTADLEGKAASLEAHAGALRHELDTTRAQNSRFVATIASEHLKNEVLEDRLRSASDQAAQAATKLEFLRFELDGHKADADFQRERAVDACLDHEGAQRTICGLQAEIVRLIKRNDELKKKRELLEDSESKLKTIFRRFETENHVDILLKYGQRECELEAARGEATKLAGDKERLITQVNALQKEVFQGCIAKAQVTELEMQCRKLSGEKERADGKAQCLRLELELSHSELKGAKEKREHTIKYWQEKNMALDKELVDVSKRYNALDAEADNLADDRTKLIDAFQYMRSELKFQKARLVLASGDLEWVDKEGVETELTHLAWKNLRLSESEWEVAGLRYLHELDEDLLEEMELEVAERDERIVECEEEIQQLRALARELHKRLACSLVPSFPPVTPETKILPTSTQLLTPPDTPPTPLSPPDFSDCAPAPLAFLASPTPAPRKSSIPKARVPLRSLDLTTTSCAIATSSPKTPARKSGREAQTHLPTPSTTGKHNRQHRAPNRLGGRRSLPPIKPAAFA